MKTLNKKTKKVLAPELLAPAGDLNKLKYAFAYGADAVYMGLPAFCMRSRENEFDNKSFEEGAEYARKLGKKFYVTVNIYPRNNKIESFKKHFAYLRDVIKPSALIIADPGLIDMAKEIYPEAVLHLSVQANALNYKTVEFWAAQGVSRVILPRELMLSEIAEIHKKVPSMELETFVHGAICMAYSGRCLISNYMTGRDSNQGICAHSCRWKYKMYIEEEMRPGKYLPIEEDDHGSYIMNSHDNCQIEYLRDLMEAGVCSLKIEGRNKTEYYLSVVARAYRKALDDMMAGREFDRALLDEFAKISNRGYIPGFLKGFPGDSGINLNKSGTEVECRFLGVVKEVGAFGQDDLYRIEVRNRFEVGDKAEVVSPVGLGGKSKTGGDLVCKISEILNLKKEKVDAAHGGAKDVYVRLKKGIPEMALLRSA